MSPPLTPSADEARRLLADELRKPTYIDAQGWLWDQLRKLLDWLGGTPDPSLPNTTPLTSGQGLWIGIGIAAVIAVAIWALMGPLRAERRQAGTLFDEDELSGSDLRVKAAELAASGNWGPAVVELFRAMIRSLSERAVIEEFPGMTADEASALAAGRLPELAGRLAQAATHFDLIAYGRQPGSAEQYQLLVELDAAASATRPLPLTTEVEAAVEVEVVR